MVRKYSKSTQTEVKKEMHRFKKGTAHSGPKLKKVKSREQAIAIALSKARKKGAKVPPLKKSTTKGIKKSATAASRKRKSISRKRVSVSAKRKMSSKARAGTK